MSRSDEDYNRVLHDVQNDLRSASSAGGHIVFLGFLSGAFIYAGIAASAFMMLGEQAFLSLDPKWFGVGALVGAGPALACILAGYMGRQSLRTNRANRPILRASQVLLLPTEAAGSRVQVLSRSVREEVGRIDELIESSHASLADMKQTLELERSEISRSIEGNSKQIQTMVGKLADERQALAELTSAVDAQAEAMSDTIPRQARLMAEAARAAQQEVAKADDALQARLEALDASAQRLGEALAQLRDMSKQGENNAAHLVSTIASVEQRLKESAKVVDAAVRASELAASAATETGDSLNAAVASALDGTREASDFIRNQSREAVGEAMKAMTELRHAGEQAESALTAVGAAARAQAVETEQRIDQMSESLYQSASRATSAVEAGLDRARLRMERATALLTGAYDLGDDAPLPTEDPRERFTTPPPVTSGKPSTVSDFRPRQTEEQETEEPTIENQAEDDIEPNDFDTVSEPADDEPLDRTGRMVDPEDEYTPESTHSWRDQITAIDTDDDHQVDPVDAPISLDKDSGLTWKDLLAGLDTPAEERDEAARYILSEIGQCKIELSDLFTPKMVKKLAGAARRGDRHRRRAVREFAGSQVQTLLYRLQDETAFRNSVDRFLTVEEPDALRLLTETEKSRSTASPRLAAYLLLDSAMSSI